MTSRIDRVLNIATQFKGALATVMLHHLPPGATLDDILSAYTYTMGELILEFRHGHVPQALDDAAVVTDRLPAVIRDVLAPTYLRKKP